MLVFDGVVLIKREMEDGGRKVVNYVPDNFHQMLRLLIDEIGIDTFVCAVSPMERNGYFTSGTGNDYSTKVARSARRLVVEVNENMSRVQGDCAAQHVSEIDAIVENHVPLLEPPSCESTAFNLCAENHVYRKHSRARP